MTIAEIKSPKSMFTKDEIEAQRLKFEVPELWTLTEDKHYWILRFGCKYI